MAKITIMPKPGSGVITNVDEYTAGPQYIDSDQVRLGLQGFPEPIKGWTKFSTSTLTGVARNIHGWHQLNGVRDIATHTSYYLYLIQGGVNYDITPLRVIDDAVDADPFATVDTSTTVTVTHTNHEVASAGVRVIFSGATAVNGLTIDGTYTIVSIIDTNTYTITAASAASGTGNGGGASVLADYTLDGGLVSALVGFGWGASTWGSSTWGTARSTSDVILDLEYWSLDNWGEDLIAAKRGGKIYTWDATLGPTTRAVEMTNAPSQVGLMLVSGEDRHVIAFGAHNGTAYDPMLIRWCDQEDYTVWTAAATNTAGDKRLDRGSKIVAVTKTRGQILVWTDTDLYSMTYTGGAFIFAIDHIASNNSSYGVHSAVASHQAAYWMSNAGFHIYDGVVKDVPCGFWDEIADNISSIQVDKVFAALNEDFNEIWFFWGSDADVEPSQYAIWNYRFNSFVKGTMNRTTWLPEGLYASPVTIDSDGQIWYQETGQTANEAAMTPYIETGVVELGEGDRLMHISHIIPAGDITANKQLTLTLYSKKYPNDQNEVSKSRTLTATTSLASTRLRGRQFRFKWSSIDINNAWKLGAWRVNIKQDGGR